MSLEQKLRDSLNAQVAEPPPARDLATRSLQGATAVRRRRTAIAVTAVAIAAIAVPLALQPSHSHQTPVAPATGANTPSTSAGALPIGAPPQAGVVLDNHFVRADAKPPVVSLPTAVREAFSTPVGTVIFSAAHDPSSHAIYVVRNDGTVKDLVGGAAPILGIAVDATRVAYSVQVVSGELVKSNLVLLNVESGKELQRLDGAPNARPVAFSGSQNVVLSVGDGAESSSGSWRLDSNTFSQWPASAGNVPLDAVGNVALVAEGDSSCVAVVGLEPFTPRFSRCSGGDGAPYVDDRFGTLAPDGKRYAGSRSSEDDLVPGLGSAPETWRWPVVGDAATGATDDRIRSVFRAADLHVDASAATHVIWEDDSHILVNALDRYGARRIVRCDVDAATCEIAFVAAISSQSDPQLMLVRGV